MNNLNIDMPTLKVNKACLLYVHNQREALFICEHELKDGFPTGRLVFSGSDPEHAAQYFTVSNPADWTSRLGDDVFWSIRSEGDNLVFGGLMHECNNELRVRFENELLRIWREALKAD